MANIQIAHNVTAEHRAQKQRDKEFWAMVEEVENKPLGTWTLDDWYLMGIAY